MFTMLGVGAGGITGRTLLSPMRSVHPVHSGPAPSMTLVPVRLSSGRAKLVDCGAAAGGHMVQKVGVREVRGWRGVA
jgi:hypothetical protein